MNMVLTPAMQQRLALGICILLSALIGITLLYAFWQWHADWELAHRTPPQQTLADKNNTSQMIAAIPEKHLFGLSMTKLGEVPLSNLQLRVTGIVKAEGEGPEAVSKVYISLSDQPSKIYEVGDALPSTNVKIYSITPTMIILENEGRLEKLPLPRPPLQFKPLPNTGS